MLSLIVAGVCMLLAALMLVLATARKGANLGYAIAGGALCCVGLAIGGLQFRMSRADDTDASAASSAQPQALDRATLTSTAPAVDDASVNSPIFARHGDTVVGMFVADIQSRSSGGDSHYDVSLPGDQWFMVVLLIMNKSETTSASYETWRRSEFPPLFESPTLTDDCGVAYEQLFGPELPNFPGADGPPVSIAPQSSLLEILFFEAPVNEFERLDLALPARNLGGDGFLRVQIDRKLLGQGFPSREF